MSLLWNMVIGGLNGKLWETLLLSRASFTFTWPKLWLRKEAQSLMWVILLAGLFFNHEVFCSPRCSVVQGPTEGASADLIMLCKSGFKVISGPLSEKSHILRTLSCYKTLKYPLPCPWQSAPSTPSSSCVLWVFKSLAWTANPLYLMCYGTMWARGDWLLTILKEICLL